MGLNPVMDDYDPNNKTETLEEHLINVHWPNLSLTGTQHKLEETYQDSLKLVTSAESVENVNEKEAGKEISKPVEDDKASSDEVRVSDTDWTSPDKDLNGDILNSEMATTWENDQTKSISTSLHNAQDKTGSRIVWTNENEELPLNILKSSS